MSDLERTLRQAGLLLQTLEIRTAVKWWAEQLRVPPCHEAGDPSGEIGMIATIAAAGCDPLDERILHRFTLALSALTACLCADTWNDADPHWGSAYRILATDYGPDATLRSALENAGIKNGSLRMPIKTVMWISPGSVKVRCGYGAEVVWLLGEAPEDE